MDIIEKQNVIEIDGAFRENVKERFIRYAKIHSTSSSENADKGIIPSTPQQFDFARELKKELESLGFKNIQLTENCYLYANIPATLGFEKTKPFCLLAHMDTVEEVSGLNVNPQVFKNYDGKIIDLKGGIKLDPSKIPALRQAAEESDTVITTDGTTLLGGDDKAGITIIVSALEYLMAHKDVSCQARGAHGHLHGELVAHIGDAVAAHRGDGGIAAAGGVAQGHGVEGHCQRRGHARGVLPLVVEAVARQHHGGEVASRVALLDVGEGAGNIRQMERGIP